MKFSMTIRGKVIDKIKNSGPKTQEIFKESMKNASTAVMEETIREAPAATGNLRKSIRRELHGSGLKAEIFPSVKYGEQLHGPFEGGGAYGSPHTIPAKEAMAGGSLYRWGQKRGINPFAVRATISKRGVKYNKYMKRAAKNTESKVKEIFELGINKLAAHLGD